MAQQTTHEGRDKMNKAEQAGSQALDKGKQALDKAKDAAGHAISGAGEAITGAVDSGAASVGGGMKSLAGTLRDQGPHEGMLGDATATVAKTIEQGGRYLEKEGVTGMAEDLGEMIKKNPVPAVLVAIGVGFLLGQLTSSRS